MKKETKQPREEIWSCGDCGDRVFPNGEHICHKKPRECCEKCYDVYFEKDWPAHTAYPCCTNEICECHKPIPAEKNFLQVGRTIECGTCHPEKFGDCKELRRIYNEIAEVRDPWRAEWLDADFKVINEILHINYNHRTVNAELKPQNSEPLENCLMENKTPGIDLEAWLKNANRQGLPPTNIKKGSLYYWHPGISEIIVIESIKNC